jgi:hypothetical protein
VGQAATARTYLDHASRRRGQGTQEAFSERLGQGELIPHRRFKVINQSPEKGSKDFFLSTTVTFVQRRAHKRRQPEHLVL